MNNIPTHKNVNWREIEEFKHFTPAEWAMYFIGSYGQIDGSHHKDWVLDQAARILNGTEVNVSYWEWPNGESEYRVETAEPSQAYLDWVKKMRDPFNQGIDEYDYHEGIAP